MSKQIMHSFPEETAEIDDNSLSFETISLKKNLGFSYYKEYNTRENSIIKIDRNINLFPLNQFDFPYEEEKKSNLFLVKKRIFKVEYPLKDMKYDLTDSLELNEEKLDLLFKKFSQCFTNNVTKEDNNNILNMTLGQIFEEKNLYKKDLKNWEHNLKVINELRKEKSKANEILKKKYCELYKDYLNSNEYNIKINKIMHKYKGKNDYIKRFIYFSRHFMELF